MGGTTKLSYLKIRDKSNKCILIGKGVGTIMLRLLLLCPLKPGAVIHRLRLHPPRLLRPRVRRPGSPATQCRPGTSSPATATMGS